MGNPPRSVYDAARARTFESARALRWGPVIYGGNVYDCAVSLDGEGYEMGEMGPKTVQRIKVSFSKRELPTRPTKGAKVLHAGMAFEIDLVGGDMEGDPSWSVTGFRIRGADA